MSSTNVASAWTPRSWLAETIIVAARFVICWMYWASVPAQMKHVLNGSLCVCLSRPHQETCTYLITLVRPAFLGHFTRISRRVRKRIDEEQKRVEERMQQRG